VAERRHTVKVAEGQTLTETSPPATVTTTETLPSVTVTVLVTTTGKH
jgi:hypothetical protein